MAAGFRCKQFYVNHAQCAMKVSTDALMLGAWVQVPPQGYALDIGTGTGILSLMLAQRSKAIIIDAIELDSAACAVARANVQQSPWSTQINIIERDILTYPGSADHHNARRYPCLISNPPYFTASLPSRNAQRRQARHNDGLPFQELFAVAQQLAAPAALFHLVLPIQEFERSQSIWPQFGWRLVRHCHVKATPQHDISRVLFSLQLVDDVRGDAPAPVVELLTIRDDRQEYTADYRRLLADFYLRF
jgi:tRNA1Val (adenine37-N6)-methyltransferase